MNLNQAISFATSPKQWFITMLQGKMEIKKTSGIKKYITGIIIILGFLQSVRAQRTYLESEVSGEIFKNFEINLSPQIRFSEGFDLKEYFFDTGVEYKFNRYFSAATSYRLGTNVSKDGHTNYGRFALDVKTKIKLNNFKPKFRLRYTNFNEDFSDETETRYHFLRYKFELEYHFSNSHFKPYIYSEFFQNLTETGVNGLRFEGGLNYKINYNNVVGAYYRKNSSINTGECFDVIGLMYKLKL